MDQKKAGSKQKDSSGGFGIDPETIKKIKESLAIPIPEKDEFWRFEGLASSANSEKRILGIFKKRSLSVEEINDLRKSAIQTPGNTRARIQKLKNQYPNSAILYMLSAICTHGMLLNSSNQREMLKGLKIATKEAAIALSSNGISVYNCDYFFKIYFTLVERFKRQQIRNYETVNMDPRLESHKQPLVNSMRIVDQLASEKSKVFNVVNHLKKKLKSSQYTINFNMMGIRESVKHIESGNPKEKSLIGTAGELIAYIYALTVAFARIPVLFTLADDILKLLPDSSKPLLLRKISINSVRNFARYRIAAIEGDRSAMAKLGMTIFKENMVGVQKLDGQSLYQSYETDSFFNVAFVAELTVGLFKEDDHRKILDSAISAVDSVIKRDMSKNHIFTESATAHSHKLIGLKSGGINPEDQVV
ncbi:MAG: hypothetical protein GY866_24655 [Proteobacteria bacterium]|nr:hypothetical protein [Pseudomonadota bacterium]